jgi:transcriptional regulator with XRE-family HTH domain
MSARISKQAREYLGFSPSDVASKIGLSVDDFTLMEAGELRPSASQLATLSRLYGRDSSDLLMDGPDPIDFGPRHSSLDTATRHLPVGDRMEIAMFARFLRHRSAP